jgi:hypothetical protein
MISEAGRMKLGMISTVRRVILSEAKLRLMRRISLQRFAQHDRDSCKTKIAGKFSIVH